MATVPLLSDEQWAVIEPLLPPRTGVMGRPMRDHRPVVEGAIYRLKAGIPWRCLPAEYGAWQTVHRRHARWSADGTWDQVLARLQADADARGELDWALHFLDGTTVRAHPHAAGAKRGAATKRSGAAGAAGAPSFTCAPNGAASRSPGS